jgi:hypothetical protein
MGDMLVIMPSRGRPEKAIHAIAEGMTFSTAHTHYWIGVDEDDPKLSEYEAMLMHRLVHMHERVFIAVGPRLNLVQWTNFAAKAFAKNYRYLASFGDDHVPESLGWDSSLIQAIEGSSGGIGMAYPEDLRRNDIPEAVVMSSSIVSALGWMMEPSLQHFYVDNVWADLGNGANCLQFCPHVTVRHNHYQANPQVQRDNTYAEAESHGGDDEMAYQRWRTTRMDQDIQTIKSLRGES